MAKKGLGKGLGAIFGEDVVKESKEELEKAKAKNARVQMSEAFITSVFLALSGGFQDAYTYFTRDEVFSNAQTGNVVLMSQNFMTGKWEAGLKYLFPLFAFALGVLIAEQIQHKYKYAKRLHWRQGILGAEIIILFIVGFIPQRGNMIATVLVSFACAMQVQSFRKVNGFSYASTMCIGNLRSGTENLHHYLHTKERKFLDSSLLYYGIIICFIIGAVIGNAVVRILHEKAILGCSFLLFVAFLIMFIDREKELRENSVS